MKTISGMPCGPGTPRASAVFFVRTQSAPRNHKAKGKLSQSEPREIHADDAALPENRPLLFSHRFRCGDQRRNPPGDKESRGVENKAQRLVASQGRRVGRKPRGSRHRAGFAGFGPPSSRAGGRRLYKRAKPCAHHLSKPGQRALVNVLCRVIQLGMMSPGMATRHAGMPAPPSRRRNPMLRSGADGAGNWNRGSSRPRQPVSWNPVCPTG